MSVLERLKALIMGAKKDVIENISDEEVLNRENDDLKSKQTYSNDIKTEEKKDTSIVEDKSTPKEESPKKIHLDIEEDSTAKEDVNVKDDSVTEDVQSETKDESEVKEGNNKKEEKDNMTLLDNDEKLTLDNVNPDFTAIFIDAGIDSVEHCFQCGTCTGGCPSGRRTPYRVRQLVRKCLMGLKDEVISDPALWMCTTCYTCQERCPREIKIVEIVKMARNVAAQAGFMAPAHKATGSFVIKTGHGVPINDATMKLRKRVGLDELPPTTHSFPEALEEVQKICEATGFDDLIGFNKETGELE